MMNYKIIVIVAGVIISLFLVFRVGVSYGRLEVATENLKVSCINSYLAGHSVTTGCLPFIEELPKR
jgi:hypothetical protein